MAGETGPTDGGRAQPAPPAPALPLEEEARVGETPTAEAVNAALLALSRAARSFLLYEPNNATVRHFIEDLRVKMKRALDGLSALDLEVRPFELVLAGEVVYLEQERERSLAFRLFRDGVRRVRIARETRWDEIQRLLEILSIRYTGVRQNEDDVVTLLRKADFTHVTFEAVEGFVPAEGTDEAERLAPCGEQVRPAPPRAVPADWDLPARALPEAVTPEWRAVAEDERRALCAEEEPQAFATNTVRLVKTLLDLSASERQAHTQLADFCPLVSEVRDFLLSEGDLEGLVLLVRTLYAAMPTSPEACAPILRAFTERGFLRRLVLIVAPGALSPPPAMVAFLDLIPADHLTASIDLLGEDADEQARRILRQLVERYASTHPEYLLSRLRDATPRVACDLLRACARALPERALDAALELADHKDAAVVHEALRRFEKAPANPRVARTLAHLLESAHEDVRLRALDLISRRHERAAFSSVAEHAERRAVADLSAREADLIGRTLARLAPESALALFEGWLRPKGLVGRWVDAVSGRAVQRIMIAGLAVLANAEADGLLREIAQKSEGDLKRLALDALGRKGHKADGDD